MYSGKIVTIDLLSDQEGTTVCEHNLQRKYQDIYKELNG